MSVMILKPLGPAVNIGSTNSTISNSTLVYVVATNAANVIHITNGNNSNTEWANLYITNTIPVILQKSANDYIVANGCWATPIAYR